MTDFYSARKISGWKFPELTAGRAKSRYHSWEVAGVKECNWIYSLLVIYSEKHWRVISNFPVLKIVDQSLHSASHSRLGAQDAWNKASTHLQHILETFFIFLPREESCLFLLVFSKSVLSFPWHVTGISKTNMLYSMNGSLILQPNWDRCTQNFTRKGDSYRWNHRPSVPVLHSLIYPFLRKLNDFLATRCLLFSTYIIRHP